MLEIPSYLGESDIVVVVETRASASDDPIFKECQIASEGSNRRGVINSLKEVRRTKQLEVKVIKRVLRNIFG